MNVNEIKIRDPYIYCDQKTQTYFLYRSHYVDYPANVPMSEITQKIECFVSKDLVNWQGPDVVFEPSADFWGKYDFWAPEVHCFGGYYYLIATFNSDSHRRACHILKSDSPNGPFKTITENPITPDQWESLDGTLYVDKNQQPWLIFSHEWLQIKDGSVEIMPLSKDLTTAIAKPKTLFNASCQPFAKSISCGSNSGLVTDGPFIHEAKDGRLIMIWSTFGEEGYVVAQARSNSIEGPWQHRQVPLLNSNGGHGMIFRSFDGQLLMAIHSPNSPYRSAERLSLIRIHESGGWLDLS